jgi:hypothetical protein
MPGRNHCQSVVCEGYAMARNARVRREREHKSVVPGGVELLGDIENAEVIEYEKALKS